MRIDVITLHAVKNYGSVLQAFATQKLFEEFGHEVTIINYIRKDQTDESLLDARTDGNMMKKIIMYPSFLRWKKVFGSFLEQNLNLTHERYLTLDDFNHYPLNADIYCTGSDQVWNSQWNRGIEYPFYLSFVPKNKFKFAFAASFGTEHVTEDELEKTKPYIQQYRYISTREYSGKRILESQYQYSNPVFLLDPTLSQDSNFWRNYESDYKIKEDYILIYNLNRSREFDNYAKNLAQKTGLKLVRLCTRYDQFYRPGKSILIPEVREFISLIDNAAIVLTDSFHATAFSLNMGTEPICIYPKEFGGRIKNLLEKTECLHRHAQDYHDFSILERPVDFQKVHSILNEERICTRNFLKAVFDDADRLGKYGLL